MSYNHGKFDAETEKIVTKKIKRRLSSSPDYWQGLHDNRPNFPQSVVEDPTRPSGWCISHMELPKI